VRDILSTRNDTPTKQAILDCVPQVIDPGSPEYVPGPEKVLKAAQPHGWTTASVRRAWRKICPGWAGSVEPEQRGWTGRQLM